MERDIKVKICGITTEEEAGWLSEEQVEYAGFVIWENSKRFITVEGAKEIFDKLNPDIKKVAVTVSPDEALVEEIEAAGFDILQVHGTLTEEVIKTAHIPIWRAVNISGIEQLEEIRTEFTRADYPGAGKITAVLADAKEYGSGKTFGWEDFSSRKEASEEQERLQRIFAEFRKALKKQQIDFILAGGLTPDNVQKGMTIFVPDVLDVSSGVERESGDTTGTPGKDRKKIRRFVQSVRM